LPIFSIILKQIKQTLKLENNGGFSSLRTGNVDFDLSNAEGLVA